MQTIEPRTLGLPKPSLWRGGVWWRSASPASLFLDRAKLIPQLMNMLKQSEFLVAGLSRLALFPKR